MLTTIIALLLEIDMYKYLVSKYVIVIIILHWVEDFIYIIYLFHIIEQRQHNIPNAIP